jgi:hypothetical protein
MELWADWLADNPRDHARCPGLTNIVSPHSSYHFRPVLENMLSINPIIVFHKERTEQ